MKRAPSPRPRVDPDLRHRARLRQRHRLPDRSTTWPRCCGSINLGCIDLNQWYARCDDVDRPDYLHFDLDPVGDDGASPPCGEAALVVNETLVALGMPTCVKTTGSRGLHVYVPIVRGPTQKQVWEVSKTIALDVARRHPAAPHGRLQEGQAPGRPRAGRLQPERVGTHARLGVLGAPATPRHVSTPVTWDEVDAGVDDRRLPHRQRPRPPPPPRRPLGPHRRRQQPLRPRALGVRQPLPPQTSVARPESRDLGRET